jgi:hypothetical protein
VVCFALAVITWLVYRPVRHHDFVLFDDADYVSDNRVVQSGLTPAGIQWAFTTGHAANWHPVTWLSHMLDAQLFGPGPAGPHLVNLVLPAMNAALLFLVLRAFTARAAPARSSRRCSPFIHCTWNPWRGSPNEKTSSAHCFGC